MLFEDWMTKMRAARKVPFGTAYEYFAREAWNAAISEEREACAKACEDLWQEEATAASNGTQEPKYHDCIECAHAIRERSNADVTGLAPAQETTK